MHIIKINYIAFIPLRFYNYMPKIYSAVFQVYYYITVQSAFKLLL